MFPIIYSDDFLLHDTGAFHAEKPGRLTAIKSALERVEWAKRLEWKLPTSIESRSPLPWIEKVHDREYITSVEQLCKSGGFLDPDTPVSAKTYEVALLAVNAWLDGVDIAFSTGNPNFILARPPGHHAEPSGGMGFCIFGNAAIAAIYALANGAERVAILDWDVHHGNGTQAVVENNSQLAYCSLHEFPHYPGTGKATERGVYENVLNLPMQAGSSIADYQPLFETKVIPFLSGFNPDLLIVSAGYDANHQDPLANISLQLEDFGILTEYCLKVTHKIVFGLEGGYEFDSLGQSVVRTIGQCLGI
jgi:acetoin utilization deacetylase AcuC-like enzyme